ALESGRLDPPQERRLIARLLSLEPSAVRPFRAAGRMRGLPARALPAGDAYVLAEEPVAAGRSSRLYLQKADGLLEPLQAAVPHDLTPAGIPAAGPRLRRRGRAREVLRRGRGALRRRSRGIPAARHAGAAAHARGAGPERASPAGARLRLTTFPSRRTARRH